MAWRRSPSAPDDDDQRIKTGEYHSGLFEALVEGVARLGQVEVLDFGPTTPDNIIFWAERGHRLAAIDLVARRKRGEPLDLSGRQFGGVLCWNVLSTLPREDAKEFVGLLRRAMIPGAILFAIFDGGGQTQPLPLRYRIVSESRLRFEPIELDPPPRAVSTSEIEDLLTGFKPTRMTVMRHGSREALGYIPRPETDGF